MIEKYIGIGTLSLYYFYILYCFISSCIGNILLSFKSFCKDWKNGLFGLTELVDHTIIQNLYKNLGYIIFGVIFYFIFSNKKKEKTLNNEETNNKNSNNILIYNKTNYYQENIVIHLLLTCFILAFHSELNSILGSFDFSDFDFWILNIIFTIVFMNYFFKIKLYKHQIYSLAFNFFINLILLIICTFVEEYKKPGTDSYSKIKALLKSKLLCIPIILIYALNSLIISFSRVKAKVLMEINYMSPYKIIILTGCFGLLFCIIILTITSIFNCNKNLVDNQKCKIKENEYYYYDSISLYFSHLNDGKHHFLLEILLITPLYSLAKFIKFFFEILMIYYLNPIFILISESTFYGVIYLFQAILNENFKGKKIITFCADIFSILSYLIYLEIIELRFCGLDTNTRKNIDERGRLDSFMIECGDINESNESIDE